MLHHDPAMQSLSARQPGKGLLTLFFIISAPIRMAFLSLYYIPRSFRENPQWSYRQALSRAIVKMWLLYISAIEFRMPKSLEPGAEKERFIHMEPAEPTAYRDVLDDVDIRPATTGGMWYPKLYSPADDVGKWIILHFHGGAFVLGGCRPREGGWGPDLLARRISGLSLCCQYRLALDSKSRFPAAVQDAVTSYRYLLSRGVPASRIILSGDSAGGNLAITLLRYLISRHHHNNENNNDDETTTAHPLPRAVLLWAPWLNLTGDFTPLDTHRNVPTDYLPPSFLRWGARAYSPPFSGISTKTQAYISPLGNEFATGKVPIFLETGMQEIMYDDHIKFANAMNAIPGNRVEVFESRDAPHDVFGGAPLLGFEREAERAVEKAVEFLDGI
jgi:acetyl esterase/lipase